MKKIIALTILLGASTSLATVDSIGSGKIPFSPPHAGIYNYEYLAENWNGDNSEGLSTQAFCMTDFMYYDHYSSSALPKYERIMKPFYIPSYPEEMEDMQINELADGVLQINTDWEAFEQYVKLHPDQGWSSPSVHEPTFEVNVSGYDKSTAGGRLKSLVMAKLAILTLHYNMAQYNNLFRMSINVVGLPNDQTEFVGSKFTKVYARTQFPYSGPSPLAQKYYQELITPEFCQPILDEAKTFLK